MSKPAEQEEAPGAAVVSESLVSVLAPYIGENMARASVGMHLQKLGLSGAPLTPGQVETLIDRLGQGLKVFLGKSKAAAVVASMKAVVPGGVR